MAVKRLLPITAKSSEPFKLVYRHCGDNTYRVWQSTWANDQFEVFAPSEFVALKHVCKKLSINLVESDED